MKKAYIMGIISVLVLSSPGLVSANNGNQNTVVQTAPPVVSIGVGNGNTPENAGPVHESTLHGSFDVFATVLDNDLENYHFRIIKDGGPQGHICTASEALFAPENQGYASTTLNKDACGFNFNQSVYTTASGFSNMLIATLNTDDLVAFGGEGDYWLIVGGRDTSGSRTAEDYLNDPKIKITISNSAGSPVSDNTSGGSSIGSGSSSGGSSRPATGQVLGASCGLYMEKFIRSGMDNDSEQVMKLQTFLNKWMGSNLPITGFYGPLTLNAVNTFQVKYTNEILTPWSISTPTGIVYQTTLRWINMLECPELSLPIPFLVDWSLNPDVPQK